MSYVSGHTKIIVVEKKQIYENIRIIERLRHLFKVSYKEKKID